MVGSALGAAAARLSKRPGLKKVSGCAANSKREALEASLGAPKSLWFEGRPPDYSSGDFTPAGEIDYGRAAKLTKIKVAVLRVPPRRGRIHLTQSPYNLSVDANSAQINHALRQLDGTVAMARCHVLITAGLECFDDTNMDTLLELLTRYPAVFALNLGEKPRVSRRAWLKLLAHLKTGHVPCVWTDKSNAGSLAKAHYKAARSRRRELEARAEQELSQGNSRAAAMLVPWRTGAFWCQMYKGTADWSCGKCSWHPKKPWKGPKGL